MSNKKNISIIGKRNIDSFSNKPAIRNIKYKQKDISISEIHDIPVFYDSPEIRRLIAEIESTKYVILDIANKLALKAERQSKSEDEV